MLIRRIARPLLSAVFIGQGIEALRSPQHAAETARPAAEGIRKLPEPAAAKLPQDPETLARVTAAVQIGGGVLLASGRLPRVASAALALTVVPGSLGGHLFWSETDPHRKAEQRREFLTDLSLIGGLMIASVDTAGKPSLGWRSRRAAERVSAALPFGDASSETVLSTVGERLSQGLRTGAERGRELADVAGERAAPLVDAARERGAELAAELAETARERGSVLAGVARERGAELAETAWERGSDLAETARKRADKAAKKTAKKAQKKARKKFG